MWDMLCYKCCARKAMQKIRGHSSSQQKQSGHAFQVSLHVKLLGASNATCLARPRRKVQAIASFTMYQGVNSSNVYLLQNGQAIGYNLSVGVAFQHGLKVL